MKKPDMTYALLFLSHTTLQSFVLYTKNKISNFIETATLKYISEIEFTDEFETKDILENKSLITKLKKGSKDAKNKRGRFVQV